MILYLPVGFCSRQVLEIKGKHCRKEEIVQDLMLYEDVKKSQKSDVCYHSVILNMNYPYNIVYELNLSFFLRTRL